MASSIFILLLASCDEPQLTHSADGKFSVSHNNKDALYFKIDIINLLNLFRVKLNNLIYELASIGLNTPLAKKLNLSFTLVTRGELLILRGNIIILIVRFLKKSFLTNYSL
ncbi:hypothetical protein [Arsenophonus endosymbiont of Bemisia tabaci]|uniref:hypothetical protein n=1 Tax=Arsenophonus endosymbiont of Bemisia tabaci TaxID=536059 RepID=UPI0015F64D49|nr:hypothetical protein [Arsenophonus endosymbiont of Bemisia tabaci]CAA2930331.1 hypothetical protein ARSQ2_01456 [Arsenophonus endosymbiont of Bemisia tabaci Q2]